MIARWISFDEKLPNAGQVIKVRGTYCADGTIFSGPHKHDCTIEGTYNLYPDEWIPDDSIDDLLGPETIPASEMEVNRERNE